MVAQRDEEGKRREAEKETAGGRCIGQPTRATLCSLYVHTCACACMRVRACVDVQGIRARAVFLSFPSFRLLSLVEPLLLLFARILSHE